MYEKLVFFSVDIMRVQYSLQVQYNTIQYNTVYNCTQYNPHCSTRLCTMARYKCID